MKGTNQLFPKFYLQVFPIKKKRKLRIAPAIRADLGLLKHPTWSAL